MGKSIVSGISIIILYTYTRRINLLNSKRNNKSSMKLLKQENLRSIRALEDNNFGIEKLFCYAVRSTYLCYIYTVPIFSLLENTC